MILQRDAVRLRGLTVFNIRMRPLMAIFLGVGRMLCTCGFLCSGGFDATGGGNG